ncbi:MAG: helix-turn-helix domain-containing protein [candidate division WOR-3 bacterium]
MGNKTYSFQIVQYHIRQGQSLRKTARQFGLNYMTLYKWIKSYEKYGKTWFYSDYRRPWNRISTDLEKTIVFLKESCPALTVRKARDILHSRGIKISVKGIWSVWKRYGLAGFENGKILKEFPNNCSWSTEATKKIEGAKSCIEIKDYQTAASLLNSIPALPQNDLIIHVPDSLLNIKRRMEKYILLYGKVPLSIYRKQIKEIYKWCIKNRLCYSLLRIGVTYLAVLSYINKPEEMLKRIKQLKTLLKTQIRMSRDLLYLKITLLICEGIANVYLNRIKNASEVAKICHTLLRKRKNIWSYDLLHNIGALYIFLENFRKAEYWYSQTLKVASEEDAQFIMDDLAQILFYKGEYRKALNLLRSMENFQWWAHQPKRFIFEAMMSLVSGKPNRAISLCHEAITVSKKEELFKHIIAAYSIIASAYCSLGRQKQAIEIIKKILPFAGRGLKSVFNRYILLTEYFSENKIDTQLNKDTMPVTRLLNIMIEGSYRRAFSYAKSRNLMGFFYQYIFYFPQVVTKYLEKGKPTRLPRAIIRLPIFNTNVPVYEIKFLGKLIIDKCGKDMRVELAPKDETFIIFLSFYATEPKKSVNLDKVYANFWPGSENASRNFSHLLVRIKKTLKIPTHLLEISRGSGTSVLINQGIYFTTDYQEFNETLTRAKALERAGEWEFARKEFLRAFKLFRGEPFKKNFDNWSVDMRFKILSQFETEAINFAKSCLEHNNKTDARKILQKVLKIIPDSQEAKRLLNG